MSLPPSAPGWLYLPDKSALSAYLERDAAARFESVVSFVVGMATDQNRRWFLDRVTSRQGAEFANRIRRAAWGRMCRPVRDDQDEADADAAMIDELFPYADDTPASADVPRVTEAVQHG